MSILNTPYIRKELVEIHELQEKISTYDPLQVFNSPQDALEHLHTLYALVEKQHVVYTRLCLETEDKPAQELRLTIEQVSVMMGRPEEITVAEFYSSMKEDLTEAIKELDPKAFED